PTGIDGLPVRQRHGLPEIEGEECLGRTLILVAREYGTDGAADHVGEKSRHELELQHVGVAAKKSLPDIGEVSVQAERAQNVRGFEQYANGSGERVSTLKRRVLNGDRHSSEVPEVITSRCASEFQTPARYCAGAFEWQKPVVVEA